MSEPVMVGQVWADERGKHWTVILVDADSEVVRLRGEQGMEALSGIPVLRSTYELVAQATADDVLTQQVRNSLHRLATKALSRQRQRAAEMANPPEEVVQVPAIVLLALLEKAEP